MTIEESYRRFNIYLCDIDPLERFIIAFVIGYIVADLLEPKGWAQKIHGRPVNLTDEENKRSNWSYLRGLQELYNELRHAHIHLGPEEEP